MVGRAVRGELVSLSWLRNSLLYRDSAGIFRNMGFFTFLLPVKALETCVKNARFPEVWSREIIAPIWE